MCHKINNTRFSLVELDQTLIKSCYFTFRTSRSRLEAIWHKLCNYFGTSTHVLAYFLP